MRLGAVRRLHFMGAGGVGMCGLAELALRRGLSVSGCDSAASSRTRRLEGLGADILIGHDPSHLDGVDALVVTSAVAADHPEVRAARDRGLPVVRRSELLAEAMRTRIGIAVAGTHGKTTTTAMIGHLLEVAGLDPTVVVGGTLPGAAANVRVGDGPHLVCEADEYDRSFLALSPAWAVVTNLEAEHLDTYGSEAELEAAFAAFADRVPFYGAVVLCADDEGATRLRPALAGRLLAYGIVGDARLRASELELERDGTAFAVHLDDATLGSVRLPVPGRHNVLNALAAIGVGLELELDFPTIAEAMGGFVGVGRRFEPRGERDGVTVVDDYAHHPTEVAAALEAGRQAFPGRRLVAVFQPHLYSRTRAFAEGFARALLAADVVVILPIYPAREAPIEGVDSGLLVDAARRMGHASVEAAPDAAAALAMLADRLRPGDVLLTLGAGDVDRIAAGYLEGAA